MWRYLTSWLRDNLGLAVLLVVTAIIYAPSLSGGFVIDDTPFIRDNPFIREFGNIGRFFTKGLWEGSTVEMATQTQYRPMALIYLTLSYQLWGANPAGYHVLLLLLHLVNICLVYVAVRKLVAGSAMSAAIGATIFALHPTMVGAVAWIAGGIDPLATFFLLGAFLAHQAFASSDNPKKEWRYLALSLLCFQLAMWTKEVAIIFPLIVVAYSLVYKNKINWTAAILHALVVVAYLVARSHVLGDAGKMDVITLSKFSKAIDFAFGYSGLLVFPVQIPFYLQPPEHSVSSALGVTGAVAIALLAGFSWRTFNPDRKKHLMFAAIWMTGFFWPAVLLAFYGDGYYAARWLYIPMIGAAIFTATFYDHLNTAYPRLKKTVLASSALIVVFYGFVTLKEIPDWHDNQTIYSRIARLAPESPGGFSGLGNDYFMRGDYAAAERNFLIALQKAKTPQQRADTLVALGTIHGISNNLALSERYLREAVQIEPGNSDAWGGLGNLAWLQGRFLEAIPLYEKAISIRPNYEAMMNLAAAYDKTGQLGLAASVRQRAAAIRR